MTRNGREQPKDVYPLGWIEPSYLGIQWPGTQILPTPFEEIDQTEFMRLMFCGAYSLCGINYASLFLEDPAHIDLWFHCPNQGDGRDRFNHTGNYAIGVPVAEVDNYIASGQAGQCKKCHTDLVESNRHVSRFPEQWSTHFYFYPDYAVAQANYYTSLKPNPNAQRTYQDYIGRGIIIPDHADYAYIVRFWRIGCQHKSMQVKWEAMHDRHDRCPDCGFHAQYDTSG